MQYSSIPRKESWEKVSGRAKYTDDLPAIGTYHARLLTSPHAHARILKIDTSRAEALEGVKAVITGSDCPWLFGILLQDRPAIALNKVRLRGGAGGNGGRDRRGDGGAGRQVNICGV